MKSIGHAVFLSSLLILTACGESRTESENRTTDLSAENRPEHQAIDGTAADAGPQRQEERRAVEAKLQEFGNRLNSLKAKADKLGQKAEAGLKEMIQELETKLTVAEKRIDEFKAAGAESWQEAKSKAVTAMNDLEESYDRVIARLKKST